MTDTKEVALPELPPLPQPDQILSATNPDDPDMAGFKWGVWEAAKMQAYAQEYGALCYEAGKSAKGGNMCDCYEKINANLESAGKGFRLKMPFRLDGVQSLMVRVEKLSTLKECKDSLFCTFCPFCGVKYEQ